MMRRILLKIFVYLEVVFYTWSQETLSQGFNDELFTHVDLKKHEQHYFKIFHEKKVVKKTCSNMNAQVTNFNECYH
jgi:hypothetical protein